MPLATMVAIKERSQTTGADRLVFLGIANSMGGGGDYRLGVTCVAWICDGIGMPEPDVRASITRIIALNELYIEGGLSADADQRQEYFIPIVDAPIPYPRTPKTGHPPISPSLRLKIYKRDGFKCVICGTSDDLTIDLKHPWSLGGTVTEENMQTMCRPHNSSKGARI